MTPSSPVYIFDEIDANLDPGTRQIVAQWLLDSKQSKAAEEGKAPQYITTTFRRELVERADACIGMSAVNNASRTFDMEIAEAVEFINSDGSQQ